MISVQSLLIALVVFILVGVILSVVGAPYAWLIALILAVLTLLL